MKTQLVVDKKTMKTICLSFCNGKKHDFRLFKESGVHAGKDTEFETDTGYTGITAIHPNSVLPKKRSKNTPLTKEEKRNNRLVSKKRIYAEHAIRKERKSDIINMSRSKDLREAAVTYQKEDDIVVMDNLSCHKVKGIKEAIESVGASVLYLPPYSPDLNPIEMM